MGRCHRCRADNPPGARFCNACGATLVIEPDALAGAAQAVRKTVTVIFCDVTGSTALGERLDAETLRRVLADYFSHMQRVIEGYGGTVEKFIGDAVMAVFGVPTVHEDDALRAVRAAWEMMGSVDALNENLVRDYDTSLQIRIGIDTGEVVAGTHERLATGDTVNVAARFEQEAQPGQILLGEQTRRLTHRVADVIQVDALAVRGKSLPVPAYRLLGVRPDTGASRHSAAPIVGRQSELQQLTNAFDEAVRERGCRLFTVVGAPGVGKSRLTSELLASLDGAVVLQGRCLPYGNGITYWPIIDAIKPVENKVASLGVDTKVEAIMRKLIAGETAASTDEIAWAFRRLVEAVAAEAPLVLVFDDIQWGEEAFLDLVEHLALTARDAPILILSMGRPELLEKRTRWVADMHLEPLPAVDTEQLIEQCLQGAELGAAALERIRASAGGNPFFVEEMVTMVQTSGDGAILAPPTIQALLAARIDQLDVRERQVLVAAAVEGEIFHRGAIEALLPEERSVTRCLNALARKDLVLAYPAELPGEDGFRFRHLLIRDAAYDSTPKAVRAQLHDHFAGWLEGAMIGRLPELDAIIGYHLEQSVRLRAELGPRDAHVSEMALRAGKLLGAAGERALVRGDVAAAISLMERAVNLLPSDDPGRLRLLPRLGRAAHGGSDFAKALAVLDEAVTQAAAAGGSAVEHRARIERARVRESMAATDAISELASELEIAIPLFEQLDDEAALAEAWHASAVVESTRCRYVAMGISLERALFYARRVGDEELAIENEYWQYGRLTFGPTRASAMASYAVANLSERAGVPRLEAPLYGVAAMAEAFLGHFDNARELYLKCQAVAPPGLHELVEGSSAVACSVEMLAGNWEAAEREARRGFEYLEHIGALGYSCSFAADLAHTLYALGRHDEAARFAETSRDLADRDDVQAQTAWRQELAKVMARRGDARAALRLAHEALELIEPTDALNFHGDALVNLSEVLRLVGRSAESAEPLTSALALYEQKQNLVSAANVRALLDTN